MLQLFDPLSGERTKLSDDVFHISEAMQSILTFTLAGFDVLYTTLMWPIFMSADHIFLLGYYLFSYLSIAAVNVLVAVEKVILVPVLICFSLVNAIRIPFLYST